MKKLLVLMMALVLTLSLAACVENNTVSDSDITPSSSDSNTEESIEAGAVKLNFTFRAKTQFRSMIDVPPLG